MPLQVGFRDRVLQDEPRGLRPVGADEVRSRPSDRLDDPTKTARVPFVDAGHPRLVADAEEFARSREFGAHRPVPPGHLQKFVPERLVHRSIVADVATDHRGLPGAHRRVPLGDTPQN